MGTDQQGPILPKPRKLTVVRARAIQTRLRIVRLLRDRTPDVDARALEQASFAFSGGDWLAYTRCLKRIIAHLQDDPTWARGPARELPYVAFPRSASPPRPTSVEEHIDPPDYGENSASMIRCAGCGSDNVAVYNLQTRSADEGMTTFYCCRECDRRWKCN